MKHADVDTGVPVIFASPVQSMRTELTRRSLNKSEIMFDKERARRVLGEMYAQFLASGLAIPQNAPQWKYRPNDIAVGSMEHRVWLWSAAATDLRSESELVYHAHRVLWVGGQDQFAFTDNQRSTRELYTKSVLDWSREDFENALAKRIAAFRRKASRASALIILTLE